MKKRKKHAPGSFHSTRYGWSIWRPAPPHGMWKAERAGELTLRADTLRGIRRLISMEAEIRGEARQKFPDGDAGTEARKQAKLAATKKWRINLTPERQSDIAARQVALTAARLAKKSPEELAEYKRARNARALSRLASLPPEARRRHRAAKTLYSAVRRAAWTAEQRDAYNSLQAASGRAKRRARTPEQLAEKSLTESVAFARLSPCEKKRKASRARESREAAKKLEDRAKAAELNAALKKLAKPKNNKPPKK